MANTQDTIPSLYGGVSQQAVTLRSKDQCGEQVNAWGTIADGLSKRAPTEHVNTLPISTPEAVHIHHINRDLAERYIVVVSDGDLKVYDHETGAEYTVDFPDGKSYLSAGNPKEDFALVTVADYTFIVNKTIKCAMDGAGADTTPDPTYYGWLNARITGAGGEGIFNQQYSMNPTGGQHIGKVQTYTDLPETANQGDIYEISSAVDGTYGKYYVRRNGGVWDETVKPAQQNSLLPSKMPHALARNSDGTFTLAPFSWAPRRVGDTDSNPEPLFIGRKINDVFFYQNRLGFLVDESVVMSVVGDFGNFWRNTVVDLLSEDVLSIASSQTNVNILRHAVPFGKGLMLFSDQTQFTMTHGEDGLSLNSAKLLPATALKMQTRVSPVALGSDVYFCSEGHRHARIYEYAVIAEEGHSAADVTAHVPRFIPSGVTKLTASPDLSALFALTSENKDRVYVYQFHWAGQRKAQSAWHYWEFGEGSSVLSAEVLNEFLYLIVSRPDGVFIERMNLHSGALPDDHDYQIYIDRRTAVTGTYLAGSDTTEFVLPYAPNQPSFRLVRPDGSLVDPLTYSWQNSTTLRVTGKEDSGSYLSGASYTMIYCFSPLFMRDREGNPTTSGRLQIHNMRVYYQDTAYFKTSVAPYGESANVEEVVTGGGADFTAKTVGSQSLILNKPVYRSGSYPFSVRGQGDQALVSIINDSHVGSTFLSAEWSGSYSDRASR